MKFGISDLMEKLLSEKSAGTIDLPTIRVKLTSSLDSNCYWGSSSSSMYVDKQEYFDFVLPQIVAISSTILHGLYNLET